MSMVIFYNGVGAGWGEGIDTLKTDQIGQS